MKAVALAATDAEPDTTMFAPDDPEAPPLVMSTVEPGAVPSSGADALSDPGTLQTLHKLAGAAADPEAARGALIAALSGDAYDRRDLPDARTMAVGMARAIVKSGIEQDAFDRGDPRRLGRLDTMASSQPVLDVADTARVVHDRPRTAAGGRRHQLRAAPRQNTGTRW